MSGPVTNWHRHGLSSCGSEGDAVSEAFPGRLWRALGRVCSYRVSLLRLRGTVSNISVICEKKRAFLTLRVVREHYAGASQPFPVLEQLGGARGGQGGRLRHWAEQPRVPRLCVLTGPPPRQDGWGASWPALGASQRWAALFCTRPSPFRRTLATELRLQPGTCPWGWRQVVQWQVDKPVSPPSGAPHWSRGVRGP